MHNCALSKHCRKLPEQPISCCDFRTGCLIAHQLLPDDPGLAQGVLAGSRHIAEALFLLGVTGYGALCPQPALTAITFNTARLRTSKPPRTSVSGPKRIADSKKAAFSLQ
jgi:hypothetical protein